MKRKFNFSRCCFPVGLGILLVGCGGTSSDRGSTLIQPPASSDLAISSQEKQTTLDAGISTTQGGPLREPDGGSNSDPDRFPPRPTQGGTSSGGSGGSIVPPAPPPPAPAPPPSPPEPEPPPPVLFPQPELEDPGLAEIAPPPAAPSEEELIATGVVIPISSKVYLTLGPLLPGYMFVILASGIVALNAAYISDLNARLAQQGMQVNPAYIARPEVAAGADAFFVPLPGYELTDEFQNGIPVARPIQPDLGSLPGFPLPEAPPTLPGTAIPDPADIPSGTPPFGEGLDPFAPEDYIFYSTTAEGIQIRIPRNNGT